MPPTEQQPAFPPSPRQQSRWRYGALLLVTLLAGLGSRHFGASLPAWVTAYAGDALWALLVFWLVKFTWPQCPRHRAAGAALGFAVAIELSQLYHTPALDHLRATRLGGLVLGRGFLWSDIVCYAVGVLLGVLTETGFARKNKGYD